MSGLGFGFGFQRWVVGLGRYMSNIYDYNRVISLVLLPTAERSAWRLR